MQRKEFFSPPRRVALFVTCMVDMIYPNVGLATVELLERHGVEVIFPEEQTCCGQPAFNAGDRPAARQVAIQFLKAFKDAEVIVAPSGSCVTMVREEYPVLFAEDSEWLPSALKAASITCCALYPSKKSGVIWRSSKMASTNARQPTDC